MTDAIVALTSDQKVRYDELNMELMKNNIRFRNDSDLCWDYVFHASRARVPKPADIVLKLQKSKYLHEFCNFPLGLEFANQVKEKLGRLQKDNWLRLLRKCVLATTDLKGYPKVWPWELDISVATWKSQHDRTEYLKKKNVS
jgi:hypothetical protein